MAKMDVQGASVEFEGELAKKGANFLDRWQDRYFVLTDEGNLYWYKDVSEYKAGDEAQGSLDVKQIIRVATGFLLRLNLLQIGEKDEPGYFDLITPGRSYQLHASSSGTYYDLWVRRSVCSCVNRSISSRHSDEFNNRCKFNSRHHSKVLVSGKNTRCAPGAGRAHVVPGERGRFQATAEDRPDPCAGRGGRSDQHVCACSLGIAAFERC